MTMRPDDGTAQLLDEDELLVLRLLAEGETVDVAARRLGVSERTVRRKARSGCDKVGCETTIEAIVWAVRRELL